MKNIPNIRRNIKDITITLKIPGRDNMSDLTHILSPSFLDIILKGLKTLNKRNILSIFRLLPPVKNNAETYIIVWIISKK